MNGQRQTATVLAGTPDQHTITYGYTAGKITSITSSLAGAFGFGYDVLGRRLTLSYPNGITGTYSYHPDQQTWLTGISYAGNLPIYSVSYPSFDMVGNRAAKVENASKLIYLYDAVYRLLNVTGSATESFTYDDAGNRLTDAARTYSCQTDNQLTAAGASSYAYNASNVELF